jgi:acetylornithine deacetylase/succinyl-diaminopimelate desuccinylase-like protein
MASGEVELLVDRRMVPDENSETALREFELLMQELQDRTEGRVTFELLRVVQALRPNSAQEQWAAFVQRYATAVLGQTVPTLGWPIYTDARLFSLRGIPTILYGAGDTDIPRSGLNGADESMLESDLRLAADVLTGVITGVIEGELD